MRAHPYDPLPAEVADKGGRWLDTAAFRALIEANLTRRARSEEPRNEDETREEIERFGRAVLLAGAPLAKLEDSRYRSRIYRGMAITV
jgi:hypothetical protein